jgi:LAGLIDADG endonuclease
VAIKSSMNLGLSQTLQAAFQDIILVSRPVFKNNNLKPEWLAGFASAEGCFFVNIFKSPTHKLKEGVQLEFSISQHLRDELLMKSFIDFLKCGNVLKSKDACYYRIGNILDLSENIVPLFKKYPILGEKSKDFSDFCEILEMIKDKKHLTKEGLDKIKIKKAVMNTGRASFSGKVS